MLSIELPVPGRKSTVRIDPSRVSQSPIWARSTSSAQLPLVVALAKRHAPRAQDVIGGDGVEMKVGQRKGKKESLRRESELSRRPGRGAIIFVERAVEGNVQRLAGPAIDLGGRERLQRRYRLVYQRPQPGERHRPRSAPAERRRRSSPPQAPT